MKSVDCISTPEFGSRSFSSNRELRQLASVFPPDLPLDPVDKTIWPWLYGFRARARPGSVGNPSILDDRIPSINLPQ
jgi:hypothetical protein